MRSDGEIKTQLIRLRFGKKIPLAQISRDSGCSVSQVISAMKMEATETIQRRLDAYLDAGQLHKYNKTSALLSKLESLSWELYRYWNAQTLPMKDVMLLSENEQRRLYGAMTARLKRMLREKVEKDTGRKVSIRDSWTYWKAKAALLPEERVLAYHRKPDDRKRKGSVTQGVFDPHPYKDGSH